jgi:protein O-GlcNAc transferase
MTQAPFDLAKQHHQAGRFADAEPLYRQILSQQPNDAPSLHLLGILLTQTGRTDAGISMIRQALAIRPDWPEAHGNLGIVLQGRGEIQPAIDSYQRAIQLRPDFVEAKNNLSFALRLNGQIDQAVATAQEALALRPDYAPAYINLGFALESRGELNPAIEAYRKALTIRPDLSQAQINLSNALCTLGQTDQALAIARQAVATQGNFAAAQLNLANILQTIANLDEAIARYQLAHNLDPNDLRASINRLFALHFHPGLNSAAILSEHKKWNDEYAAPFKNQLRPHENDRNPNRKLRIGYVSPDFRQHCQSFFTIPLLWHHDHQNFEIICYADVAKIDEITQRIQKYADQWKSTVGLSDAQVADMIRADRIDVLVDLTMHMSAGKPLVFARKPAAVQIAWLAYPGTTGLAAMDYRLTDPFLDPPGSYDADYVEQSIRLPQTFWCYDPLVTEPPVNPLPALSNGFITFGCLNNFCKVTDPTLALWSRVLLAVPNSRLILMSPPGSHRNRVVEKLKVEANRIEFLSFQPRPQYLQTYHRIDLGLDTFPYNGHTTSLDSLWMGVPVVSLMGQTVVSRAGFSQTSNLGLADELVAKSEDQFVEIAKKLSGDFNHLSQLRSTLRQRMEQSPLMDGKLFARGMETIFRDLWIRWCQNRNQNPSAR